MGRLTEKDERGNWSLKGMRWCDLYTGQVITKEIYEKLYGALWKLMEYEDTGLDPEQIRELDKLYAELCKELAKYRWIPVTERSPEKERIVLVTVHSSEWINDYESEWVSEEEKFLHQEEYCVYMGLLDERDRWVFLDDTFSENECEKEFGSDKGRVYDVVIAWQQLPEPYKDEIVRGDSDA